LLYDKRTDGNEFQHDQDRADGDGGYVQDYDSRGELSDMAAQTYVFNAFLEAQADGTNQFSSHNYKAALMDSGYTPDIDNDEGWSDVSADEVTVASGYTTGGETMANIAVTRYDATNRTVISWDQVRWDLPDGLSGIAGVMVYNDSLAGKLLVEYCKMDTAVSVSAGSAFVAAPTVRFNNGGA
jgi:hypothetical protein